MVGFTCPNCDGTFQADDGDKGRKVRCPGCGNVSIVPPISGATAGGPASDLTPVGLPVSAHKQLVDALAISARRPVTPGRSGAPELERVTAAAYSHPEMRSVGVAYGLWLFSLIGLCGIHRIYSGKVVTGVVWLLTLGILGVGQLVDLVLIPGMVRRHNSRLLLKVS